MFECSSVRRHRQSRQVVDEGRPGPKGDGSLNRGPPFVAFALKYIPEEHS
jgi:hypothetical protein